jgi:hypothetical protein
MEIHQPRYDASKDAQILEDPRTKKKDSHKRPENELPEEGRAVDKRLPRKSAVSEQVNVMGVLDHVLNAKVELAIGEIIGVSRELSGQLANVIKFRPGKQADAVGLTTLGNSFKTKTRGLLIKIMLECDGNPIEAIIDTGSQLNIVNEKICKSKIRRPIDCTASLSMNDANGGEGKLNGMVENVPLEYGSVLTRANLYVGAHVPFDLLLGRPWQRGNLVSIDELEDGTYLIFKDPSTKEPRHKVLVTPDAIITDGWGYDPSTWFAKGRNLSYFVDCGSANDGTGTPDSEEEDQVAWLLRRDYPDLEKWEFPSLFLGRNRDMDEGTRNIVRPWLQEILLRFIMKPPNRVPEWSAEREGWIIKERGRALKNPPTYTPYASTNMEIKLGPATVQHEGDLIPLFSSPQAARSEAEALLAGLGSIENSSRSDHLRDIVLTSHDGVIVGHGTDDTGFRRTDLMLFKMGLVTPKSTSEDESHTDLDIQYGTGIVHFYPNLGGEAPPDWRIPYLFPSPSKVLVSCQTDADNPIKTRIDTFQVDSGSAIGVGRRPPDRSLSLPIDHSEFSDDSDDNDEIDIPCFSCLTAHHDTCASLTKVIVPTARISINCAIEHPTSKRDESSDSLPALTFLSDDSDSDYDAVPEEKHTEKWKRRWEKFEVGTKDEIEMERGERVAAWDAHYTEQNQQEESGDADEFARELDRALEDPKGEFEHEDSVHHIFTPPVPGSSPMSLSSINSSSLPTPPDDLLHHASTNLSACTSGSSASTRSWRSNVRTHRSPSQSHHLIASSSSESIVSSQETYLQVWRWKYRTRKTLEASSEKGTMTPLHFLPLRRYRYFRLIFRLRRLTHISFDLPLHSPLTL